MNTARERFGIRRLERLIAANGSADAKALIERLGATLAEFAGSSRVTFERTALVIRRG